MTSKEIHLKDLPQEQQERYKKNSSELVCKLISVYIDGVNDILDRDESITTFEIFCILTGFVDVGLEAFKQNVKLPEDQYLELLNRIKDYFTFEVKRRSN